ncbi:MAG: DUF4097 family beta strand repeat-containing protein [Bryobacteraceae bacterium]|nr:DUF4097 family beta strand repeat-containing protein [Bryobacteraceae bacterium]
MKRGSIVGPMVLILIGAVFLMNNLRPDLSLVGMVAQYWPFLLIGWGVLRLAEIFFWAAQSKPLPQAGISGGEWTLIVFLSLFGSGAFFATHRDKWPGGWNVRLRGLEMLGEAFDYPVGDRSVPAGDGRGLRVVIESFRGNARITGSKTVTEVRVTGRKTVRAMDKAEADRAASALNWEVIRQGDAVYIRPNGAQRDGGDVVLVSDLDITVPQEARIEAHGRRGDFDVTDVNGDVSINSDNAGVRLQNLGGNVRVDLRASDVVRAIQVKGDVEVRGTGNDVELESIGGQVTVGGNYYGDLQFRSIAKPVKFEGGLKSRGTEWRVEACPGQVRMSRGNLSMEDVAGPVTVRSKTKDVQVTRFTGGLDLQVDRGDLEIRPGLLPVPRVTALTKAGNVELTLPENGTFALKASVGKGDIENDFEGLGSIREENRGAVLNGSKGSAGAELDVRTERGTLRVRKGGLAEAALPSLKRMPVKPIPPDAAKAIVVERNQ